MILGNYHVVFNHITNKTDKEELGTYCIMVAKNGSPSTQSKAVLYYKDSFSKAKGRKAALAKALNNLKLSKEERTKIWEDYKNICKL